MKEWFKGFVQSKGLKYALVAILTASGVGAPIAFGIATGVDAGAQQYYESEAGE